MSDKIFGTDRLSVKVDDNDKPTTVAQARKQNDIDREVDSGRYKATCQKIKRLAFTAE